MSNENSDEKTLNRSHKQWFAEVVLLLLAAGGFALWFFMTTLLAWAVITAITIRSDLALPDPMIRRLVTVLLHPVSLFGRTRPVPALLTLCINAAVLCLNMILGWRWIKAGRSGRFALLLLAEFFIISCAVFAVALHIAASPWARNPHILGL